MSTGVQPEQNRVKTQGNAQVPGVRREEQQEFDSWRHQTHQHQQQGFNPMSSMASDPYLSSFYAGSYHYQGFGVGDGETLKIGTCEVLLENCHPFFQAPGRTAAIT